VANEARLSLTHRGHEIANFSMYQLVKMMLFMDSGPREYRDILRLMPDSGETRLHFNIPALGVDYSERYTPEEEYEEDY